MRMLVATSESQGEQPGDFGWADDEEPVMPPVFVCDRDRLDPELGCGCGRSWTGITSRRSTTTAVVVESDAWNAEALADAVQANVVASYRIHMPRDEAEAVVYDMARMAHTASLGDIITIRLGRMSIRARS